MSDTTPIYLIDENGDRIVDENGDKILIGEVTNLSLATQEDIERGLRLARKDIRSIKYFEVLYDATSETYYTKFNNHKLGGRFDSVGVAYGQVLGTYIQNGSTDEYAEAIAALTGAVDLDPAIRIYGMNTGPHATRAAAETDFSQISWITFTGTFFTNAGLANPTSPGNDLSTQSAVDAYVDFIVNVTLESLDASNHVDGNPICIDPEDTGFDKAFKYMDVKRSYEKAVDLYGSGIQNTFANLRPYSATDLGVTGTLANVDWVTVVGPMLVTALGTIRDRVRDVYPNSPVGWYNLGPAAYWLTGWSGLNPEGNSSRFWEQVNDYFDSNIAKDPTYFGWQALEQMDWTFNAYYPAVNDAGKLPFTFFGSTERLKNFFWSFVNKFGPSSAGAEMGEKMVVGISIEADANPGTTYTEQSGLTTEWQRRIAGSGGLTVDYWGNSTITYTDVDTDISTLSGQAAQDFVISPIAMQGDLIKWIFLPADGVTPDGWQTPISAVGLGAGPDTVLADSMRDFKVAIWDKDFKGTVSDGTSTFRDNFTAYNQSLLNLAQHGSVVKATYLDPYVGEQWVAAGSTDTEAYLFGPATAGFISNRSEKMIDLYYNYGDDRPWSNGVDNLFAGRVDWTTVGLFGIPGSLWSVTWTAGEAPKDDLGMAAATISVTGGTLTVTFDSTAQKDDFIDRHVYLELEGIRFEVKDVVDQGGSIVWQERTADLEAIDAIWTTSTPNGQGAYL